MVSFAFQKYTRDLPSNILAVIFHDDVDEVVHSRYSVSVVATSGVNRLTVLITNENLAIEHFVISQDVVDHFLVKIFRRCLKVDLHSSSFLYL